MAPHTCMSLDWGRTYLEKTRGEHVNSVFQGNIQYSGLKSQKHGNIPPDTTDHLWAVLFCKCKDLLFWVFCRCVLWDVRKLWCVDLEGCSCRESCLPSALSLQAVKKLCDINHVWGWLAAEAGSLIRFVETPHVLILSCSSSTCSPVQACLCGKCCLACQSHTWHTLTTYSHRKEFASCAWWGGGCWGPSKVYCMFLIC